MSDDGRQDHGVNEIARDLKHEQAIFEAARHLSPSHRAAFLDATCAGDMPLRQRIESLLASEGEADDFFRPLSQESRPPEDSSIPSSALPEEVGETIGRYKLLQKIGEGGMGEVYMAEQREPVVRKVALKIIKLGMDTKQVIGRFEAERQALALMDHANIAGVLDGGVTESGRPYFVMDLVQGLPINRFCDDANLSTHDRLALFLDVCSAVQHAHQKGIIHRDLKPSNILVTLHGDKPVPKVIDFGVAKATQGRLTDKTIFTQFQHFVGTPAYMSPEQAGLSGLDVDTRSDIYALGVLLYELLTGATPFDGTELLKAGLDEMRRIIRETEPLRPSTRLSSLQGQDLTAAAKHRQSEPTKLLHLVRGDLDWIVMKCLEKDRSRRYETANGLAMDIQRHLDNEPIVARPPSAAYRFQKLVRRNQLKFATAAFAVSVLLLAVLVSTWQAVKATRAERKAHAEAERANQESELASSVKDFLIKQVLGVNPFMEASPDPNRRALIEKLDRAIGTQFSNQPRVEAELRYALGDAFNGIGDTIGMVKQLERVLEIRRQVFGLTNSDTLWALASTAEEYYRLGRWDDNEKLLREGLAVVRAYPHALSSGEAEVLGVYAERRYFDGYTNEALSIFLEVIAIARQTADPKSWRFQNKLMWLARFTADAGQIQEAEAMFAEQIRFREREFGPDHPVTAQLLRIQGEFFFKRGRIEEAIAVFERVLPIYRRSLDSNHFSISYLEADLAQAYERQGRIGDAASLCRSVYPRLTNNLSLFRARDRCITIAEFFVQNQFREDAKSVLSSLSNFFEANPPTTPKDLASFGNVEFLLGQLCEQEGQHKEAADFYARATKVGYRRDQ